ncbi:MAG: hypothetical protein ABGW69_02175 [Nanoarchaeota archaeon]
MKKILALFYPSNSKVPFVNLTKDIFTQIKYNLFNKCYVYIGDKRFKIINIQKKIKRYSCRYVLDIRNSKKLLETIKKQNVNYVVVEFF